MLNGGLKESINSNPLTIIKIKYVNIGGNEIIKIIYKYR
jgi:hypothetical protein